MRTFVKQLTCFSFSLTATDNGPMEGFWGILKTEMYYLFQFETYEALEAAIYEYIDFYNNRRYQKRLGCMTPNEFIQQSSLNK